MDERLMVPANQVTEICGDARGIDTLGGEWATSKGVAVEHFPALWDRHGKAAGMMRNKVMANRGAPWSNASVDKESKRRYGISVPKSSKRNAVLFLTKNMKMVRIHDLVVDGEIAYPRIMLYPRMDLPTPVQSKRKTNG